MIEPIIRWVGGKRRLLSQILPHVPDYVGRYHEPFLGGAAMLLTQPHKKAFANDVNHELINFYEQARSHPDDVIALYNSFEFSERSYYEIRSWDRHNDFLNRSRLERAGRLLFLNRTSFQGMWRVNSKKSYNNSPWGKKKTLPPIHAGMFDEFVLQTKNVEFSSLDFERALEKVEPNDFVYLDPPYVPVTATAGFTSYALNGFDDHEKLRNVCVDLDSRGIKFILSNSDCQKVRDLYERFNVIMVDVTRVIAAKRSSRGKTTEVLVKNF